MPREPEPRLMDHMQPFIQAMKNHVNAAAQLATAAEGAIVLLDSLDDLPPPAIKIREILRNSLLDFKRCR